MDGRGRRSAASLAIAPPEVHRPEPPAGLNDLERSVWVAVVASKPPTWFTADTHVMLTQYCRLAARAQKVAELVHREEGQGVPDVALYDKLLSRESILANVLATLATKMRITQQTNDVRELEKKARLSTASRVFQGGRRDLVDRGLLLRP